jgi:methanogenic corrinoid protein MtbC1/DNA-binding XRE family transcriptional regulator
MWDILDTMAAAGRRRGRVKRSGPGPQGHRRYLEALTRGDAGRAEAIVAQARTAGWNTERIYLELLAPAQVEVGAAWRAGRLSVADEHLATQITLAQMERLRESLAPAPARGVRAVVACVEGETHAVGPRMLADFLAMDGWTVDYLGADVPSTDLVDFVARRRPDLVALSVAQAERLPALGAATAALRRLSPVPRILVGGAGIGRGTEAAALGADAIAPDALSGMQQARRWVSAPTPAPGAEDHFERLGHRIQELRTARGWTQQQLAEAAQLDRTYISGLERGKQNPTLGALLRLARSLETPLERLVLPER